MKRPQPAGGRGETTETTIVPLCLERRYEADLVSINIRGVNYFSF